MCILNALREIIQAHISEQVSILYAYFKVRKNVAVVLQNQREM